MSHCHAVNWLISKAKDITMDTDPKRVFYFRGRLPYEMYLDVTTYALFRRGGHKEWDNGDKFVWAEDGQEYDFIYSRDGVARFHVYIK